ncbi:ATP-binding protein [Streptomyces sp. SID3212]|uniref:ATP-binding protein n=1 Tax=Streptomyces sp. SID3212 TaxID=2690259 RepID=UPI001F3935D2|nr:ATP-binding protein [Streptomyces sp. SID3212]
MTGNVPVVGARDRQVPLTGRQEERRLLAELLNGVRDGQSGSLVLVGEPGIGKTRLLGHAAGSHADVRVVRIAGVESEKRLGFAALHRLLRPSLPRLDSLSAPQSEALGSAFGVVAGVPADRYLVGNAGYDPGAAPATTPVTAPGAGAGPGPASHLMLPNIVEAAIRAGVRDTAAETYGRTEERATTSDVAGTAGPDPDADRPRTDPSAVRRVAAAARAPRRRAGPPADGVRDVFRKLGITSRRQLASVLDAEA